MHFIETMNQGGAASDQQQLVVVDEKFLKLLDEEYSKLLEAVHHGDLKTVESTLTKYPVLLNRPDKPQGNTPLHYAVAQHDLVLIEFLIQKGAKVAAENQREETAGKWYEEFINSLFYLGQLINLKELRLVIENNDVEFLTDHLKTGLSHSLRFSRGSTLLHLAVELQKPDIVKAILEGITQENINQLLKLEDSRGRTPLDLAQQFSRHGTLLAKQVHSILQEKPRTTAPEESASMSQPLPTAWPFLIDTAFKNRINELSNQLKNPIVVADFTALNPLLEVICQLACITCRQALARLSKLERQNSLEETLLRSLFGNWLGNTRLEFQKKLQAIVGYLADLIQQQQVNQVIHFSNKLSHAEGWYCTEEKKIYLNPMAEKANLVSMVIALIHETTHKVNHSYDFVTMAYSLDRKGYDIDLKNFYQLVLTGEAEELTPERVKLFELRQRLQEDVSRDWRQQLHHWMALNNADTQTLAILLLATLPENYAKFDKKQQTLLIKTQFLSAEYLNKHLAPLPLTAPSPPPVPEPPVMNAYTSSDEPPGVPRTATTTRRSVGKMFKGLFNKQPEEQQVTSPRLPKRELSNASASTASSPIALPLQLPEAMNALPPPADQPGFSRTVPTNRSFKIITNTIIPKGSSD